MTLHAIEYRGFTMRAYSQQVFPPLDDPFAKGAKRFSAIVQIDDVPPDAATSKRYSPTARDANAASAEAAIDAAMQYGRDIIDGKVSAGALYKGRRSRAAAVARLRLPK
jgi:hypothetical protein